MSNLYGIHDYFNYAFTNSTSQKETPEELNKRKKGLETIVLDYADHTNNFPSNETFTFGKSETRTTSKTFSTTMTHTLGISEAIEVSGELFGIGAKSTTTLKYDFAHASTEESSQQNSVTLSYTVATTLKPGQHVYCRAVAMRGTYEGDYTCTVSPR
jgi:hypothetical protein